MFIGPALRLRHEHSVLPQGRRLLLPLPDRFLVFDIAFSRFCGRATPAWNVDDFERVRQSLANQVYLVSKFHASARRRSLAVNLHMAPDHRGGREAACLKESTAEQPSIDAQGIRRWSFLAGNGQG